MPALFTFGFVILIAIAIAFRLMAGSLDHERIDAYIAERGGKILQRNWTPYGKGWFGSRNERIYEIEYTDRDGDRRAATVKTSMFSGVYLTDDRLVASGQSAGPTADAGADAADAEAGTEEQGARANLADEVERLRRENVQLRRQLGQTD